MIIAFIQKVKTRSKLKPLRFLHSTFDPQKQKEGQRPFRRRRAKNAQLIVIDSKDRGQPFRKQLPNTIKSRFYRFWRTSQDPADLNVRKIVVLK
jgi:hypothetical protein